MYADPSGYAKSIVPVNELSYEDVKKELNDIYVDFVKKKNILTHLQIDKTSSPVLILYHIYIIHITHEIIFYTYFVSRLTLIYEPYCLPLSLE